MSSGKPDAAFGDLTSEETDTLLVVLKQSTAVHNSFVAMMEDIAKARSWNKGAWLLLNDSVKSVLKEYYNELHKGSGKSMAEINRQTNQMLASCVKYYERACSDHVRKEKIEVFAKEHGLTTAGAIEAMNEAELQKIAAKKSMKRAEAAASSSGGGSSAGPELRSGAKRNYVEIEEDDTTTAGKPEEAPVSAPAEPKKAKLKRSVSSLGGDNEKVVKALKEIKATVIEVIDDKEDDAHHGERLLVMLNKLGPSLAYVAIKSLVVAFD